MISLTRGLKHHIARFIIALSAIAVVPSNLMLASEKAAARSFSSAQYNAYLALYRRLMFHDLDRRPARCWRPVKHNTNGLPAPDAAVDCYLNV